MIEHDIKIKISRLFYSFFSEEQGLHFKKNFWKSFNSNFKHCLRPANVDHISVAFY